MTPRKKRPDPPQIDVDRCSGCGRCVAACPLRLVTLETAGYRKHAVLIRPADCTACGACITACPLGAMTFHCFPA